MKKWKRILLALLGALFVYVGSYCVLSALGNRYWSQSGQVRWDHGRGLAVSDIDIFQPKFLWWQPFVDVRGRHTTRGNFLGYLYCPLIMIDRAFVHSTYQIIDPETLEFRVRGQNE